nr:unnamed protein product [Callosobruchus analis]
MKESLRGIYDRSYPSYSVVQEWTKRFRMGQEFLEGVGRPKQTVEVITEYKEALAEELVLCDQRLKANATSPNPPVVLSKPSTSSIQLTMCVRHTSVKVSSVDVDELYSNTLRRWQIQVVKLIMSQRKGRSSMSSSSDSNSTSTYSTCSSSSASICKSHHNWDAIGDHHVKTAVEKQVKNSGDLASCLRSIYFLFALAVFQEMKEGVLEPLREFGVMSYLDDIIAPSNSVQEGLSVSEKVLEHAQDFGLIVKMPKFKFLQHEIEYLGYAKRKPSTIFEFGDLVLTKIASIPSNSGSKKLVELFKSPFRVIEVLPNDRYKFKEDIHATRSRTPYETVEEIAAELQSIGAVKVQRMRIKKDGQLQDTAKHTSIITFNSPQLLDKIKVAMYQLELTLFMEERVIIESCIWFPMLQYMVKVKLGRVVSVITSCTVLHHISKYVNDPVPVDEQEDDVNDEEQEEYNSENEDENVMRRGLQRREEARNLIYQPAH